ncbi:MAG: redoxin domain-containing protein [Chloroflexota bacterium]
METQKVQDIEVGQVAPDFTLEDENGNKVQLSNLRGEPVILMFYPFDWSGPCTEELCELRDRQPSWEKTGARVFGVSRDSKFSHKAWKEHLGLNYSLLADLTGEAAKKFGAWNEAAHRADRMTVVLDADGIVSYVVHNDAATKRNQDEILEAVRGMVGAAK